MARAAVATKPEVPVVPDDRTEVITAVTKDPSLALRHTVWFDAYYKALQADVTEHVPDVTTEAGRDQIKSLAFRIVKARTGIEDQRKRLTENWRKLTDSVNLAGRLVRQKLEALEETARKPLVEWQAKEDARKADIEQAIQWLKDAAVVTFEDTAASVSERLARVRGINDLSVERFGERQDEAQNWYDQAVAALSTALARLLKSEAEAQELAELREQQRRVAEAQAEKDRLAAASQMAAAREAEEQRRIQAAAEQAAEQARLKAEREAQEKIDEANRQLEKERREREAERRAQQAEEEARIVREQDVAHRREVNSGILVAVMALGVPEAEARKVAVALIQGVIPHVTVQY